MQVAPQVGLSNSVSLLSRVCETGRWKHAFNAFRRHSTRERQLPSGQYLSRQLHQRIGSMEPNEEGGPGTVVMSNAKESAHEEESHSRRFRDRDRAARSARAPRGLRSRWEGRCAVRTVLSRSGSEVCSCRSWARTFRGPTSNGSSESELRLRFRVRLALDSVQKLRLPVDRRRQSVRLREVDRPRLPDRVSARPAVPFFRTPFRAPRSGRPLLPARAASPPLVAPALRIVSRRPAKAERLFFVRVRLLCLMRESKLGRGSDKITRTPLIRRRCGGQSKILN